MYTWIVLSVSHEIVITFTSFKSNCCTMYEYITRLCKVIETFSIRMVISSFSLPIIE